MNTVSPKYETSIRPMPSPTRGASIRSNDKYLQEHHAWGKVNTLSISCMRQVRRTVVVFSRTNTSTRDRVLARRRIVPVGRMDVAGMFVKSIRRVIVRGVPGTAVPALYGGVTCVRPTSTITVLIVVPAVGLTPPKPTSLPSEIFQDRSPVLGTNYLGFEWFVPETGLEF